MLEVDVSDHKAVSLVHPKSYPPKRNCLIELHNIQSINKEYILEEVNPYLTSNGNSLSPNEMVTL